MRGFVCGFAVARDARSKQSNRRRDRHSVVAQRQQGRWVPADVATQFQMPHRHATLTRYVHGRSTARRWSRAAALPVRMWAAAAEGVRRRARAGRVALQMVLVPVSSLCVVPPAGYEKSCRRALEVQWCQGEVRSEAHVVFPAASVETKPRGAPGRGHHDGGAPCEIASSEAFPSPRSGVAAVGAHVTHCSRGSRSNGVESSTDGAGERLFDDGQGCLAGVAHDEFAPRRAMLDPTHGRRRAGSARLGGGAAARAVRRPHVRCVMAAAWCAIAMPCATLSPPPTARSPPAAQARGSCCGADARGRRLRCCAQGGPAAPSRHTARPALDARRRAGGEHAVARRGRTRRGKLLSALHAPGGRQCPVRLCREGRRRACWLVNPWEGGCVSILMPGDSRRPLLGPQCNASPGPAGCDGGSQQLAPASPLPGLVCLKSNSRSCGRAGQARPARAASQHEQQAAPASGLAVNNNAPPGASARLRRRASASTASCLPAPPASGVGQAVGQAVWQRAEGRAPRRAAAGLEAGRRRRRRRRSGALGR